MRKESDGNQFNCLICKEDRHFYSFGICEHRKVCLFCCMKSRILYNDKKCPVCNTKLDNVFIYEITDRPTYNEAEANKEFYYQDDEFQNNGIYYASISAQEEALKLRSFLCPIKSCREGAFENLQTLITHLSKVHKRYYCETCLKESKKFLSEMTIYQYEHLKEHQEYGEYSESNVMLVPPHPVCPFCNLRFYNDEHLFKHMNELHFICQLCKDKKNIIFYEELPQLLEHYKYSHYVCPYQECLDDIYVVFESEEKLNAHLITKHKCTDAKNRIANFMFSDQRQTGGSTNYGKWLSKQSGKKTEFNFTEHMNDLKEKAKAYSEDLKNRKKTSSTQQYEHSGNEQQDYHYENNYSKYPNKNKARKQDQYDNGYSEDYYYGTSIQNEQAGTEQMNKRNKNKKKDKSYNNNYNKGYNESYGQDPYPTYNKGNKNYYDSRSHYGNNPNMTNTNNFNKYTQQPLEGKATKQDRLTENKNQTATLNPMVDYSFVFEISTKIVKDFILDLIKNKNPPEGEFVLPRETIYQLIVIIDKLDKPKLLELTHLSNFGIDLDVHKELKKIVSEGSAAKEKMFSILSALEIKKVLIIYKYFVIASKKIDGLFYKLDFEQIESDLYDDFVVRKKPKGKYEPIGSHIGLSKDFKKKTKLGKNDYPCLSGQNIVGITQNKKESKLNSIFATKPPTQKQTTVENKTESIKVVDEPDSVIESTQKSIEQSKLTKLLDGKLAEEGYVKPKKKNPWARKFNKKQANYEEEFPEL